MAFSQKNRIKIAKHIHNRVEFQHASMSGKWVSDTDYLPSSEFGQLPKESIITIRTLLQDRDLYIVYSYRTPIAYAYDKEIHVFDHKYSVTTTHHQSIVKLTDHYALSYSLPY